MKSALIFLGVIVACLSWTRAAQQSKPAPPAPAAAELEYDTFCKKTQQEKRTLFRAAAPAQKRDHAESDGALSRREPGAT